MIDTGSLSSRVRALLILACALALTVGCNSSSPLVWSAADEFDEDGDDQTNEEPPPPPPPVKDAGDDNEPVGNGSMDSGVIVVTKKPACGTGPGCDPTDLGGETCESLGAGSGRLLCDPSTCLFELGLCDGLPADASVGRPCGTGPGCNMDDLGGETCSSLGMPGGILSCDPETCQFDTSLCGGGPGGGGGLGGGAGNGGGNQGGGGDSGGGTFFGGGFFGGDPDAGTPFFGGGFFGGGQDAGL